MPDSSSSRTLKISLGLLVIVAAFAALAPFTDHVLQRYNLAGGGLMPLGGGFLLLLVCSANAWRARSGRPPLLSPGEILGSLAVLMMGGWAATTAFTSYLMPLITSPFVFASAANGWIEHIHPHLPLWALGPTEEPYASGFYNGLRPGVAIPWGLWVRPALFWSGFGVALSMFFAGLTTLLSRQWVEHDRLTFPHAEVIIGMVRGYLLDRRFWWGLCLAAAIPLWNILQPLAPVLPKISLIFGGGGNGLEWYKGAWKFIPELNLVLFGLFYFVHRDIVISMVIFFFMLAFESYGLGIAGMKLENGDIMNGGIMSWQTTGAILMLVIFSLWSGRSTLVQFVRSGIRGEDDGRTWMSPRTALVLIGVGGAGLVGWMIALGLREPVQLATVVVVQVLSFIGMARIAMESAIQLGVPVGAQDFAVLIGGTAAILPAGLVALSLAQSWLYGGSGESQVLSVMQGEKFRSQFKFPRALLVTAFVAVALSTIVCMFSTAWISYDRGANNYGNWQYKWYMRLPYDTATDRIRVEPVPTDPKRFAWLGAGMAVVGGLTYLRNHVVGWFLHPVGFILATMGIPGGRGGNVYIFTGLLAWIVKTLILRLGGVEAYERLKPAFAGVVVSFVAPQILGLIVDLISFAITGHRLE